MSRNSSAKYCQENKETLQKKKKKTRERYQNRSKEEKKSDNIVVNIKKISQKMEN